LKTRPSWFHPLDSIVLKVTRTVELFFENLFHVPDLFLDLAGDLLILPFKVRVPSGVADLFLDRSLRVVYRALDLTL
jgi:hypothetical protein